MFEGGPLFKFSDWAIGKYLSLRSTWLNRITWLVVLSGLLICSQPIWQPLALAFISKYFTLELPDSPSPWLGVTLVLIGLSFNYVKQKSDMGEMRFADEDSRKHDSMKFRELNSTSSFSQVRDALDWILTCHSLFDAQRDLLRDAIIFLCSPEHSFLDETISTSALNYKASLKALVSFLTVHFFVYPKDRDEDEGFQYCLYPELNFDRGGSPDRDQEELYERRASELDGLVAAVASAQESFIEVAKRRLGSLFPI